MNSELSRKLEILLKLPPEPPAPFGEEQSLRVFRASPQYLKYQLFVWAVGQWFLALMFLFAFAASMIAAVQQGGAAVALSLLLGCILAGVFVVQRIVTRLCVTLRYERHWYKVTDRSLCIREGVWFVREMTMTFANIQNMEISQGPIQRWLGFADLKVQTAGGGGSGAGSGAQGQQLFNMHLGVFRGVDNAREILQLMEERLRRSRSTGLGDTDEPERRLVARTPSLPPGQDGPAPLLEAARGVLREARALKLAVTPETSPAPSENDGLKALMSK